MKFGAVYCLYDDHEYLEESLANARYLEKVYFLISDVPWNGKPCDNSETIEFVKSLCKKHSNFELVQGHWTNEIDQRNYGLNRLCKDQIEYCFIIDSDEVYSAVHFLNIIKFVLANKEIDSFHLEWNTYWTKDYYRIWPREHYKPVVCVRVEHFLFTVIRGGITSVNRTGNKVIKHNGKYNATLIPPSVAICFHFSYARNNKYMKRKFETNSHAPEFIPDWYDNVWMKWKPGMKNLHPVTPDQYNEAVPEDFSLFPTQLKLRYKKEKLEKRGTSIIILNWNSCDLLKRCISLVRKHTKRRFELIVIDNGSTKDDSVEFISSLRCKKVLNKENLGFAKGVNQGIELAKKDFDICLLNVDAEVTENWLSEMYGTMVRNASAGMVGPLGNEVASGHQGVGYVDEDTITPNLYGFCLLVIRELVGKIGYFDEIYEIGGYEDNDYGIRAKLAGYELFISAKSLVVHKAHQVFEKNGIDNHKQDERNRELYLNKFFGVLLEYGKSNDFYELGALARRCKIQILRRDDGK